MRLQPHDIFQIANSLKSSGVEQDPITLELKNCGANKPGGGGFAAGNTCARGGGVGGGGLESEVHTALGKGKDYRIHEAHNGVQVHSNRGSFFGGSNSPENTLRGSARDKANEEDRLLQRSHLADLAKTLRKSGFQVSHVKENRGVNRDYLHVKKK